MSEFLNYDKLRDTGATQRVAEAATILRDGIRGGYAAQARLQEALTTSDFPALLGRAFEYEVLDLYRGYETQWQKVAQTTRLSSFNPTPLATLAGDIDYVHVNEAEEYKAADLLPGTVQIKNDKYGRVFPFTWEDVVNKNWDKLTQIPKRLAAGAAKLEDKVVFSTLFDAQGINQTFFSGASVADTKALSLENLKAAYAAVSGRDGVHGSAIDVERMVLVVPSALAVQAREILGAKEIRTKSGNSETVSANFLSSNIDIAVVPQLAQLNPAVTKKNTTWFLLPAAGSANPAIQRATLVGHETPDLRISNNTGISVTGSTIDAREGGFSDDTIAYRGRHVTGAAAVFAHAAYASDGTK